MYTQFVTVLFSNIIKHNTKLLRCLDFKVVIIIVEKCRLYTGIKRFKYYALKSCMVSNHAIKEITMRN